MRAHVEPGLPILRGPLREVVRYVASSAGMLLTLSCGHQVTRDWVPGAGRIPCEACRIEEAPRAS
jgi:hypothetical protein